MTKETYEIAIVGSKDAILGFRAIGAETRDAKTAEKALEELKNLKEEDKYAIVFIIENLAKDIPQEEWKKLTADALPAIIAIPGPSGSTGFGMQRLGAIVEKAIGQNILKD